MMELRVASLGCWSAVALQQLIVAAKVVSDRRCAMKKESEKAAAAHHEKIYDRFIFIPNLSKTIKFSRDVLQQLFPIPFSSRTFYLIRPSLLQSAAAVPLHSNTPSSPL
jgi:hypothetical protein